MVEKNGMEETVVVGVEGNAGIVLAPTRTSVCIHGWPVSAEAESYREMSTTGYGGGTRASTHPYDHCCGTLIHVSRPRCQ